ncbi:type II toxin-antitoxin system VapC family toxin [Pelomicrobium methylotrophicum]|uniref:Type II toxin-antitoxin system VapC family toxin n=1 Tax=Pelomicrobium methylotrophicum TaxID=2602750 RepID=A0A5C7EGD0_9PROT|nr:type II toxin-antitoxin system VapC family toxin [Pelomicrobium methylotrophicum]TXF10348.1 type II toxin-antitoxin system VapC family toxin [Pelomicrobium methylotrophicum]
MILYLDTSALVRSYIEEEGHAVIVAALHRAQQTATHLIAYAETRAALARIERMQRIGKKELAKVRNAFESDWRAMLHILPTEALVRRAGDLADQFGLRGYDSVHLAAAESLAIDLRYPIHFASFDGALNTAADTLGLRTLIPA